MTPRFRDPIRSVPAEIRERMAKLMPWHFCEFYGEAYGLSYQTCRFCHQGAGEVEGLWKYGVRHYVCSACRDGITSRGKAVLP